jgi:hypothetical protein
MSVNPNTLNNCSPPCEVELTTHNCKKILCEYSLELDCIKNIDTVFKTIDTEDSQTLKSILLQLDNKIDTLNKTLQELINNT